MASWASEHPGWEIVSKHCSEILYAAMPENLTYQGGSGLALTMRETGGEANQSCPNITALWEYDWLRNDEEPPPCWENAEGWRLISELIDLEKPYMRQANTLRDMQTLPPLKDLSSFGTSFWEPVITALLHGIPSQYPNSPIPQYAEVESLKPIRIALLRSIYGNVTPAESLREACSIVDEARFENFDVSLCWHKPEGHRVVQTESPFYPQKPLVEGPAGSHDSPLKLESTRLTDVQHTAHRAAPQKTRLPFVPFVRALRSAPLRIGRSGSR